MAAEDFLAISVCTPQTIITLVTYIITSINAIAFAEDF
jgi:hypothetical protein